MAQEESGLIKMSRDDLVELVTVKIAERYDGIIQEFCNKSRADIHKTILGHKELEKCYETLIKEVNAHHRQIEELQKIAVRANKLYEAFYENGFLQRFEQLVDDMRKFILSEGKRNAAEDAVAGEREEQENSGERQWLRRRDDRFKLTTLIVSLVAIVFGSGGIVGLVYILQRVQAAIGSLP